MNLKFTLIYFNFICSLTYKYYQEKLLIKLKKNRLINNRVNE